MTTPHVPTKIISGGQTGVDRAALQAALRYGIAVGGWCPPGRVCEGGTIPQGFPLRETPAECSALAPDVARSQRTEWNARDAQATLILTPSHHQRNDPGTDLAARCARHFGRALLRVNPWDADAPRHIAQWLDLIRPGTLNVAGPCEGAAPGIGKAVFDLLCLVFDRPVYARGANR